MSFISLNFCIFLPIVFSLYYLVPVKYRCVIILIANYIFYSFAGIQCLLTLFYITLVTYLSGIYLKNIKKQRLSMLIGIAVLVLLPLTYFKYTGFLTNNINIILDSFGFAKQFSSSEIVLPLGISFYTFSALGYVIDVANNRMAPIKNPILLAAGISFFPCLISGPIEKQYKLIPQLTSDLKFNYDMATYGLKQITWGLFEKLVLADNLSIYVDNVYKDVYAYHSSALLISSLFFTMQIYCDFAGYSDIAIGVAKLFGINLRQNFRSPYFSQSIHEFWTRWHISLSTWFKDYVYIPLGGNKNGPFKKNRNVLFTMLVSGLWHGAAWTFVLWGGVHGVLQIIENTCKIDKKNSNHILIKAVRTLLVFCTCSTLWIFFRAASFSDAWYVIRNIFSGIISLHPHEYMQELTLIGLNKAVLVRFLFCFALLFTYDYFSLKIDVIKAISSKPVLARWGLYLFLIMLVLQFSYKDGAVQFVYAGF